MHWERSTLILLLGLYLRCCCSEFDLVQYQITGCLLGFGPQCLWLVLPPLPLASQEPPLQRLYPHQHLHPSLGSLHAEVSQTPSFPSTSPSPRSARRCWPQPPLPPVIWPHHTHPAGAARRHLLLHPPPCHCWSRSRRTGIRPRTGSGHRLLSPRRHFPLHSCCTLSEAPSALRVAGPSDSARTPECPAEKYNAFSQEEDASVWFQTQSFAEGGNK